MYYQRAYPEVKFRVCPCCVDGVTKENWMNSERRHSICFGRSTENRHAIRTNDVIVTVYRQYFETYGAKNKKNNLGVSKKVELCYNVCVVK